ncbi:MAG: transposase [Thermodesulfovibrionales bacterium]|nr:transposase [Thermodesulfovibrionales bacterium]
MIHIKDHRQMDLFDPWGFLSPKRRELLDQSWAGLFQKELLRELPVGEVASFFNDDFGRPTKELHTVLGALVLQQAHDLTDDETVNQLAFNIQWHYALNITEESDSAKYMCPKTLWNMRSIVVDNTLDAILFDRVTDKLAKVFKVKTDSQRIDSVHIKSNMRRLGRIGIFTSSISKFLVNLKRGHKGLFDTIDEGILDKYLSEKSLQCFSMVKPSESAKTLTSVSADLFNLVEHFKDHPEVKAMHSYKLLERVLKEQCNVSDDGNPVEVKRHKEIPSDSLQNPSDPDATYSGHKGQGYQVQVMETYCKDEDAKEESLNLITHIQVEPAHESDANALIPAIESSKERGLAPEELLADTLYGSDENCQKAEKLGVEVISPAKGAKEEISLSDFKVSEKGYVVSCPQGHVPVRTKTKKTRHTVAFDSQHCGACSFHGTCLVKQGKKYHYLRYTDKEMRLAKRRVYEQTEEFKDRYRWRSGSEATISEYDRKTGVKHLRVRGFKAVRFCATLKAVGVNIFRATAVRKAVNNRRTAYVGVLSAQIHAIYVVKERFSKAWGQLRKIFTLFDRRYGHSLIMAA